MAKPKLALIPAAQGTKFYSVLPSNGTGDFTFTRGSVATRINAQGLIENVTSGQSRLNYPMIDGVQKGCPHHILEPARTNLLPYSESFDNGAGWVASGRPSVESNVIISPDGALNATRLSFGNNSTLRVQPELTFTNNYSYSIFVKKDIGNFVTIYCAFFTTSIIVGFDLNNGTCQAGGIIEKYGNDWYKISVSKNVTGDADKSGYFYLYSPQELGSTTSVSGNKLYVWGAQVEEGSYPTSYIPTSGTAVTRSAETASGAGNSTTFNSSEGVLMAEISALANDVAISLSDNTFNNSISFGVYLNKISAVIRKDGGYITSGIIDNSGHAFNNNKIAIKYNSSSCDFYVNGFVVGSSSGVAYSSNVLDNLNFNRGSANDNFYGKTKQLQYYNSALTESELEQLTSWQSFRDMANGQLYTIE